MSGTETRRCYARRCPVLRPGELVPEQLHADGARAPGFRIQRLRCRPVWNDTHLLGDVQDCCGGWACHYPAALRHSSALGLVACVVLRAVTWGVPGDAAEPRTDARCARGHT
eukprot:1979747-Rhodomonas_salina.2